MAKFKSKVIYSGKGVDLYAETLKALEAGHIVVMLAERVPRSRKEYDRVRILKKNNSIYSCNFHHNFESSCFQESTPSLTIKGMREFDDNYLKPYAIEVIYDS